MVKLIHTKTTQIKKKESLNAQIVGDLKLPTIEAVRPAYKDQAFRQHVVQKQVSYASILKQASPPPPSNTRIQFYCGANCLPSHKCGNPNRSATTVH